MNFGSLVFQPMTIHLAESDWSPTHHIFQCRETSLASGERDGGQGSC